jgi:hypothetical protein
MEGRRVSVARGAGVRMDDGRREEFGACLKQREEVFGQLIE